MKKHFIAVCCSLLMASQLYAQPLYKNPKAPVKDRISNLISLMTLNEKIGQLCCPLGWEMYTKQTKVLSLQIFSRLRCKTDLSVLIGQRLELIHGPGKL